MRYDRLSRRTMLGLALATSLLGAAPVAAADCAALAGANIEWIVPFSPGGGFDVYSRMFQPHLEKQLGAHVAVVNVAGAGGILGAKAIRDAAPDGHTIGIINAGGLMTSRLFGDTAVPSPADDFTLMGRFVPQSYTWFVAAGSPIRTIDDAIARGLTGDLVVGVLEVGSGAFISGAVLSEILGLKPQIVAGYPGSRDTLLAVIRGEIDMMSGTFESHQDAVDSGEVRPILQISATPVADHPSLAGIPFLADVARSVALAQGRDPDDTVAKANLVADLSGLGRFIVAPKNLPTDVQSCLTGAVDAALADPAFTAAAAQARRSLEILSGPDAAALASSIQSKAEVLRPYIERAVTRVRG